MNKLQKINLVNSGQNLSLNQTIKILRIVGFPGIARKELLVNDAESLELYDFAIKNKVPLLYLESLKRQGKLNKLKTKLDGEREKYLKFIGGVGRVSKIFNTAGIDYSLFKTIKPYPAVPGDIDILIMGDATMCERAVGVLREAGYKYIGATNPGPSLEDFVDPKDNIVIDLQEEVSLSYLIYMDKNKFWDQTIEIKLPSGEKIKNVAPELDLAIVIIHSLTEHLYTLGDYYTFIYRLSEMREKDINNFIDTLDEHKIRGIARAFITITDILCEAAYGEKPENLDYLLNELKYDACEAKNVIKSNFKMPHRYNVITIGRTLLEKTKEKRFQRSVATQMLKMVNPMLTKFIVSEFIERRRREYYLKEVE
ncbi:MAG: hypothetical protein WA977_08965 [Halobacteriota archaeon]